MPDDWQNQEASLTSELADRIAREIHNAVLEGREPDVQRVLPRDAPAHVCYQAMQQASVRFVGENREQSHPMDTPQFVVGRIPSTPIITGGPTARVAERPSPVARLRQRLENGLVLGVRAACRPVRFGVVPARAGVGNRVRAV